MGKNFTNIINGANFGSLNSPPTDVRDGDIYYDSTLGAFRFRQGGSWVVPLNTDTIPHSPGWGSLASAPSSPVDGDVYYDTVTDKHYFRQNGAWVAFVVSSATEFDAGTVTSNSTTINLDNGDFQTLRISKGTTLSFTGGAIGKPCQLRLMWNESGGHAVTWSPNVHWQLDSVPVTSTRQGYKFNVELYNITPIGSGDYAAAVVATAVSGFNTKAVNLATTVQVGPGSHGGGVTGDGGTWYTWGPNQSGNLGQNWLGSLVSNNRYVAYGPSEGSPIVGGRSFSIVTLGFDTLANGLICNGAAIEASTGRAYCWGIGSLGGIGDQNNNDRSSPVSVAGARSFIAITATQSVYGIEGSTGLAWAWGANVGGQLGDNTATNRFSPVSVVGGRSWSRISAGFTNNGSFSNNVATVEASTGNAYCWGNNSNGQLGDNSVTLRSSPVSVFGGRSFSQISCGGTGFVLAIEASTGTAWAWGTNTNGQLGNSAAGNASSPVSVLGGRSFATISAGHTYAVAKEAATGLAWTWGLNTSFQLGDGTVVNRSSPVSVQGGRSWSTAIAGGDGGVGIVDNSIFGWGNILSLGHGFNPGPGVVLNTNQTYSPTPIRPAHQGYRSWKPSGNPSFIHTMGAGTATGSQNQVVVIEASTGNAYTWGDNASGMLGDNTVTNRSSPVSVLGGRSFSQVMTSVVMMGIEASTGLAWTWGLGTTGQLGNNAALSASSPVSVVGGRSWSRVSGGNNTNATAAVGAIEGGTGRAYCWGAGTLGMLGDSTVTQKNSPTSVVGARSFVAITAGDSFMGAIEGSTGNAYTWGTNTTGQLGNNTTTTTSSPVSVFGGRSFKTIAKAGFDHLCAIDGSTGTAWCWGNNSLGQLGDNTTTHRSSPVSVFGGRSWAAIACGSVGSTANTTFGIEASTGLLYAWGTGVHTGVNNSNAASSPVSVFGGRSFVAVASWYGGNGSLIGTVVAQDGTGGLYFWGLNNSVNTFLTNPGGYAGSPIPIGRFPFQV